MEVMYGSPYRYLLPYSLRNGSMVMAKNIAVSYTHLDVYKRQQLENIL